MIAHSAPFFWHITTVCTSGSPLNQPVLYISVNMFLGKQLLYNYPDIYDKNLPESFASKYKNMAAALAGGYVTEQPWYRETTLTSLAGVSFHSFAKYSEFGKGK